MTDEDVENDCFYNVLLRLDTSHLHKHYGYMFKSDAKWLPNFVSSL